MNFYSNATGSARGQQGNRACLEAFHADAAGIFSITLVHAWQLNPERLLAAWLADDLWATALVAGFNHLPEKVAAGDAWCLLDGEKLDRMSDPLIWLMPCRDDPRTVVTAGLCPRCERLDDGAIMEAALPVLHRIWPDARLIDPGQISPTGGAA